MTNIPNNEFSARILADSISEAGHRITTMEVTLPRFVLAEFNTHRVLSRNSGSSRAVPMRRRNETSAPGMIDRVEENPVIPVRWGRNQPGMQAFAILSPEEALIAEQEWLLARDAAVAHADNMSKIGDPDEKGYRGVHKQICNRIVEPWLFHTIIVTFTEIDNFFALRCHPDAQPEIKKAADMMREAYEASKPALLTEGQWHLPLIYDEDHEIAAREYPNDPDVLLKVSTGRCARVSYLTHEGKRDLAKDIELHDNLISSGHMSPTEHPARPMNQEEISLIASMKEVLVNSRLEVPVWMLSQLDFSGNFRGFVPYRKDIPYENNYGELLSHQNEN